MSTPPPFAIRQLDHIVLRTNKPDSMLAFYLDLGCVTAREVNDLGLRQLRAGSSIIDLVDVAGFLGQMGGEAPGAEARNMDHFALTIEPFDLDTLHAHFNSIGVQYIDSPVELFGAEGIGPAIYIKDPDGNTVELKGPPSADQTDPFVAAPTAGQISPAPPANRARVRDGGGRFTQMGG